MTFQSSKSEDSAPTDQSTQKTFWVSWYEPVDSDGDYRPRKWPLAKCVRGYWCSGWAGDGRAVLCAVVDANSESDAWTAIAAHGWAPSRQRFCKVFELGWWPPADRFPRKKEANCG